MGSADVMTKAGQKSGAIVMHRPAAMKSKFEEQVVAYDKDKYTIGLVRNWVATSVKGLCPVVGGDKQDDAGYPQIACMYAVDYERNAKGTQCWRNRVMKVAQKFEGKHLNFVVGHHETWGQQMQEAGLTGGDKPQCVAYDDKATKYVMKAEFAMDTFEQFVNDYQGGKIEAHVKSKDIIIKFYAPWCGHCKSLAPKWDEMAEEFQEDDSVVIGHFNADSNDVPAGFEVKGFPTMYWMPAGKSPVKYQGGREVADFVKYVKENKSSKGKDEL